MINYQNKYLKYKNKYNNLKIQYSGSFDDITITKLENIFFNERLKYRLKYSYPQYLDLFKLIFQKLKLNKTKCDSNDRSELFKYFCDVEFNYLTDPIHLENSEIIDYYKKISKFKEIAKGAHGKIYSGEFNDHDNYSSIIKIPIHDDDASAIFDEITEAFINLCIINDIILNNIIDCKPNNLIFTFGLFFVPYCSFKDWDSKCTTSQKLNIQLIQQAIVPSKTLAALLIAGLTLNKLINYLRQIFEQLIIVEESKYELIHGDLHNKNILIQDEKVYIIDWGLSSFKYEYINESQELVTKRIRSSNNNESNYFKNDSTGFSKTGLYDLYFLIKSCIFNNTDPEIKMFLEKILDKIFYNKINIINLDTKLNTVYMIKLNKSHFDYGYWLYYIIGGYTDVSHETRYFKEVYDANKEIFDVYTYRRILEEINNIYETF